MLSLSILGILIFIILKSRKLKLFRGHLFSNTVKIMLFISDAQYFVPGKFCRTAGSINLFKITGKLTPENIKLKNKYTLGCYRIRLERSQYDFEWKKDKFTNISHDTI